MRYLFIFIVWFAFIALSSLNFEYNINKSSSTLLFSSSILLEVFLLYTSLFLTKKLLKL